jgi:uncharacterized repeat protein (TIGR03803 family)
MEKIRSSTGMTVKHFIHERGNFSKILAMAALLLAAINTEAVQFTKLFEFSVTNGEAPYAGLVLSGNTLYGTTEVGGTGINANGATDGTGTIFKINTDGTGFTTLYNFSSNTNGSGFGSNADGADPFAGLVLSNNVLYGTASEGGTYGCGTVYKVNSDGTGFATLHNFGSEEDFPTDGLLPYAGLVLSGNTLYGMMSWGGLWNEELPDSSGTIFKINTNGTGYTVLHRFAAPTGAGGGTLVNSDGATPRSGFVLSNNTLYGVTLTGGSDAAGTVFKINTDGTGFTVLHTFSGGNDGGSPGGSLTLSGNTLYGTTIVGGSYGEGTIFKINTNGISFINLFNFNGDNGAGPVGDLVLSGNILYGATSSGGAGVGTVFKVNIDGTGFTNLYNFPWSPTTGNAPNGGDPTAGLVLSGNTLYGTAGTVFALTLFCASIPLNIQLIGTNVVLRWSDPAFYLQAAPTVSGVYTNVPGAVSPYTNAITGSEIFFRLRAD